MSLLSALLIVTLLAPPEDSSRIVALLQEHSSLITEAAQRYGIKPRNLAAVIYTERRLNYNWRDNALEVLLAVQGHNSSIGFCQIKLKTAYWIEKHLHDARSPYFLGEEIAGRFPLSQYTDELIGKLTDVRTNIHYAAVYLAMFQRRWKEAGFDISNRPEILGTLYSTGSYNPDGSERLPNPKPRSNHFGELVRQFYLSDILNDLFRKLGKP